MLTPVTDSSDASVSDSLLIERVACGDREALGSLYDRYAPSLFAIAVVMLGRSDAEDVLHDVFLEVWSAARSYDPDRATMRTWLVLRMRSRCLDRLRANRRHSARETDNRALEQLAGPADRSPDVGRLPGVLSALSTHQRTVIELAYFSGLSLSEIGVRLGIPLGTVKSRAAAALSRLRELFARERR